MVSRWLLGRARWHLDACVRCASRVRCCGAFLPSVAAAPRWWGFVTRQWSVVLLWGVVSASCVSCFRRSAASSHAFDRVAAKAAGFSKTWQTKPKKKHLRQPSQIPTQRVTLPGSHSSTLSPSRCMSSYAWPLPGACSPAGLVGSSVGGLTGDPAESPPTAGSVPLMRMSRRMRVVPTAAPLLAWSGLHWGVRTCCTRLSP